MHQVVLNKGSHDGVFIGQPVLDAAGVMGQVIQIGPYTSRVLLINDPHSGVPVQDARNGVRAIAVGDNYSGKVRLANVVQTTDIKEGDIFMTSGLGEHYPEGYPLGKVESVVKDPGLQFATITIEPSAHLDRSRQVLLIWPAKRKLTQLDQTVVQKEPDNAQAEKLQDKQPKNKKLDKKTVQEAKNTKGVNKSHV